MPARCVIVSAAMAAALCGTEASAQPLGFLLDREPANNFPAGGQLIIRQDTTALTGVLFLTPGDLDLIDVQLPGGAALTLVTMPLSPDMTMPDTVVSISTGSGTVLAGDDDSGSNSTGPTVRGSVVRCLTPGFDTYGIRIEGFSPASVGDYAVLLSLLPADGVARTFSADFLELEPNNSPATAEVMATPLCGPVSGLLTISPAGDHDYFVVELRTGDLLTVVTTPFDPSGMSQAFSAPDTVVTIFGADGVTPLVESDDDLAGEFPVGPAGEARGSTVRLRATTGVRHYVRVRGFGSATGSVQVTMCVLPSRFGVCVGDVNGNGVVNAADLASVLGAWGACP